MRMSLRRLLSLAILAALVVTTAATTAQERQNWRRESGARPDRTIFGPLDLPTPNRVRTASGAPGPDYWQQQVDYQIAVSLAPDTRRIHGKEHVVYTNNSPEPLEYVWVHLEQNVLRSDSIGALIGGGNAVGGRSDPTEGVQLLDVSATGGPLSYRVYDTMCRIELPTPVAAGGGKVSFDITWEFTVPDQVFRRYGIQKVKKGTIFELAQWFPAVAVYDDVHGWNTLPYIGTGEFYTNFGTFDVSITVPRDHLVVATGVLQNEAEVYTDDQRKRLAQARTSETTVMIVGKDEVGTPESRPAGEGALTWTFHADNVRTFAWACSEAFMLDASGVDDVLVQSAYPEDALPAWSKSTAMLRAAIAGYSKRWFPYPYPMATNVAGIEGGMEYPMIIFCRARNERGLYGVTTHEIGHTWFPMVVNTDERRHAWMDEGFNTFINIYSEQEYYGTEGRRRGGNRAIRGLGSVPIMTHADQLDGMLLGMLQYMKTGSGMQLLREHILGEERFDFAFRTYIRRWAFKSPQPADFFRCMEDAAGADLAWFWRGWFVESTNLDQAVDSVQQAKGNRPALVTITNLDRMVMPLTFTITYEDDTTETHDLPVQVWFTSDRVQRRATQNKPVKKVQVDPEQIWPDAKRSNNSWTAE